ncbi:type I secretion outer membrane protein, TolC family [Epilithonimonas hungarica]|uniref:Type I secretion outer membrane protein, TolC family n=2 Tax=Epilithonimonas hungarica TaxID=454006 RepID=A0A1G7NE79_9FLAO|nr:type I secretion outer membrane protein, TolC family [Epilithonimonas hungarica]
MINNKMIKWRKLALGVLTVTGSLLYSQQSITLKQAIEYALQNKSDALKAKLDITNAEAKILEAKAGALPKINGTANLTYNPIIQEIALEGATIKMGQPWNVNAGVQVTQAVFNQQVFVGLKAAKSTKEFYQLNADLTDEQIIERVSNAYFQVFTAQEKKSTLESSFASTEKVRNVIKSLFDNGLSKKIDLDRTNVNLTNIETNIKQSNNGIAQAENALKFYMGMPIETKIQLVPGDMEVTPHLLENMVNTDERTEVKVLLKNRELLEYQKKATEAAYYPTVNLTANYNWQGMGEKFPLINGRSNGIMWSDYSSIGLGVNIPIFNGFATKAKVQQNQIEIDKLEADLKDTKLGLDQAYQNAKSQIENSLSSIENQKANVTLAESVLADTKSNYQYGLATLTDLLDAENSLVQAKNNYTNAILDYKIAEVQYYKSKGELKTYLK